MDTITRADAALQGKKKYFTGVICRKGHTAPRYVASGICTACQNGYAKASRQAWAARMQGDVVMSVKVPVEMLPTLRAMLESLGANILGESPPLMQHVGPILPPGPTLPPPPGPLGQGYPMPPGFEYLLNPKG